MGVLNFFRCLGEAVVARGLRCLIAMVPFGEQLYEIAADALERLRRRKEAEQAGGLQAEVQAVAAAGPEEVKRAAAEAAHEAAAGQPPEVQLALEMYLSQVPAAVRQSLKRPEDPTGTTVPADFALRDAADLVRLLPARPPRFRTGDRPACLREEWELLELLGVGGFGEVWKARHVDFDGTVAAVKFCLDPIARDRLLKHEAKILNQVMRQGGHPGIVPLQDASLRSDPPWLRYEYIDGGDLTSLFAELKPLSAAQRQERVLTWLRSLAETVGHFHRLQPAVVHRDLKPANILLHRTREGEVRLRIADFGIGGVAAQRSLEQATVSTPSLSMAQTLRGAHSGPYASPQQKRGDLPAVRDDVFALGVIGYQILLADLAAERPSGKWRKRLGAEGLSEGLLDLLEGCWDDDPSERPADGAELARRLEQLATLPTTEEEQLRQDLAGYEQADRLDQEEQFLSELAPTRLPRWRDAAGRGMVGAQSLLGSCCYYGIGCPQDDAEAVRWWRKAAKQGNADAQANLGAMHRDGRGVPQDDAEAVKWFRLSTEQGFATSQWNLGALYCHGRGVPQDDAEAVKWFRLAAQQGHAVAQHDLGFMYEKGRGVAKNEAEAAKWYRLAAEQGDAGAIGDLQRLLESKKSFWSRLFGG